MTVGFQHSGRQLKMADAVLAGEANNGSIYPLFSSIFSPVGGMGLGSTCFSLPQGDAQQPHDISEPMCRRFGRGQSDSGLRDCYALWVSV
jgi:hypothetical protein